MRVNLSFATTADGFLDDTTPTRLVISTPEDWAAVRALRASHHAILVGAETLRRDNPALRLRDEAVRAERMAMGLPADLVRVTVTRTGQIDSGLRFFTEGEGVRYLFAPAEMAAMLTDRFPAVEVIPSEVGQPITARYVVTELEKRGVRSLMVEGGAHILSMFLDEGMADTVRRAVNPQIALGERGYAPFCYDAPEGTPYIVERLGDMEVTTWILHPDTEAEDCALLRQAIEVSRQSPPCATAYRVGAVFKSRDGRIFTGYTHEDSPTHHAEQVAVAKALAAGAEVAGGAIYSSMEPCSRRASEPESCTQMIVRLGLAHVAFALYEPDRFVMCCGALTLREAGLDVRAYPDLGDAVREINKHL